MINLIVSYWLPPSTMDVILASIVGGRRAILLKTQRSMKKIISSLFKELLQFFFGCGLSQPLGRVICTLDCADTSNSRRLKGKRLCHHARGIYCTFLGCGGWSRDVTGSSYVEKYQEITLR
jgi:hypothetical protein